MIPQHLATSQRFTEKQVKLAAYRAGRLWLRKRADGLYQLVTTADPLSGWQRFGAGYVLDDRVTLDEAMQICRGVH